MGEVVLGLPGSWADNNLEVADHYTTKVGGLPDWPFPESSLGPDLLQCNLCRSKLCLITQVHAPITIAAVKIEERVVYVFGCTDAHCGSWRAIRVQKLDEFEEPKSVYPEASHSTVSPASTSDSKWWDDLYSFESGSEDSEETDDMDLQDLARAFSGAANLSSGSVKEATRRHTETSEKPLPVVPKTRQVDGSTLVLPCFYMCYQEDKFGHKSAPAFPSKSSLLVDESQVNKNDNEPKRKESWEEERYEYDKALHADRTYLKFKKRVDGCPEQCLRYSFGGTPLLASGGAGNPGSCGLCGEPRHFEMQVMPPLVYFLQEGAIGVQRELLDNWNWMTLMIFTCSKSCFQKLEQGVSNRNGWSVMEETVIAQFEEAPVKLSRLEEK